MKIFFQPARKQTDVVFLPCVSYHILLNKIFFSGRSMLCIQFNSILFAIKVLRFEVLIKKVIAK